MRERVVHNKSTFIALALVLLLAVGLAWGLAASFAASSAPPAAGGKLVLKVGSLVGPDSLNPFVGYENISYEVWDLNYDFVIGYAPDGSPRPAIAESWSVSPDGKTWTFKIRSGVKWQDGQPLTASDVAFTYNYIVGKKLGAYDAYTKLIDKAVAIDDTTCEIRCSKPKANMLRLFIYCFPEHIWNKIDAPEKYKMTYPIIGSGPFQTAEYKEGNFVRLEKNPNYWGGAPAIDEVLFQVYTNQDTMVQEFKVGALDAAFDIPTAQYPSVSSTAGFTGYKSNFYYLEYLAFNCYDSPNSLGNPVLKDVKFRQALNWAIDRQKLVDIGLNGYGRPGSTWMPPDEYPATWDAHYTPTPEETYGFDIAKANSLLEAAGYKDTNGDGIREANGKPIKLRLWARSQSPSSQREAKLMTDWFKQCGLSIDFSVLDNGAVSDKLYHYDPVSCAYAPDYDMYLWDSYGYADPGDTLAGCVTAQIEWWNDACWSSPEFDALNEQQMSQMDPQKRLDLIHQMQQKLYVDSPWVCLTYPWTTSVANTGKWTGWVQYLNGSPFLNAFNVDSYVKLRPVSASTTSSSSSSTTTWIIVGVAVVVVVVLIIVFTRRGRKQAVEE